MKNLLVTALCITVFSVSYALFKFGYYPTNSMFFLLNSTWSLLIIIILTSLKQSLVLISIVLLNFVHIVVNLFTCYEYITMLHPYGMFYSNYKSIINNLNLLELIALLFGVPRARMDRVNYKRNGYFHHNPRTFNRFSKAA